MARWWRTVLSVGALLVAGACSQREEDRARQRAAEARQKAREGAHELAHEARRAADALSHDVNQAVNSTGPRAGGAEATQKLRVATGEAGAKLDQAALLAKVKAKLANDAGLSTVTGVEVQVNRDVVTLRGSVSSSEQKQLAERAAAQVSGVGRVVDELQVRP